MSQADTLNSTIASDVTLTRKGERYTHENAEYLASLKKLRKEAAAEIDRLLAFLDDLDGDPDLEDGGDDEPSEDDEPSLGWTLAGKHAHNWQGIDLELDTADDEPSLGSCGSGIYSGSQEYWAQGGRRDLEEECEDEGAENGDNGYVLGRRYQNRLRKRRGQKPLSPPPERRPLHVVDEPIYVDREGRAWIGVVPLVDKEGGLWLKPL